MDKKDVLDLFVKLMDENKYEEAKEICLKIIKEYPKCSQAYFLIGIYYKNMRKLTAAVISFEKAIKYEEHHFLAYINIIRILINQKDTIKSFDMINKAKDIFPNEYLVYIESSNLYLNLDDIDMALIDNEIAIKLNSNSEQALYQCGLIYSRLYAETEETEKKEEYFNQSIIHYLKTIAINSSNTNALLNYGAMFAKKAYSYNTEYELLASNPTKSKNMKRKMEMCNIYFTNYNLDAKFQFERIIKINPIDITARYNLGLVFVSLKKYDKARYQFKKAIIINPLYEDAKLELELLDTIKN